MDSADFRKRFGDIELKSDGMSQIFNFNSIQSANKIQNSQSDDDDDEE